MLRGEVADSRQVESAGGAARVVSDVPGTQAIKGKRSRLRGRSSLIQEQETEWDEWMRAISDLLVGIP